MVITVTLNPALDKTIHMDIFEVGNVNRSNNVRLDIAGKGVNVSKVLKNFGVHSIATGFLGGVIEDMFKETFEKIGVEHRFISIDSNTRTNTVITTPHHTTNINDPGATVPGEKMNEFYKIFEEICKPDDIVVISGSAPQGVSNDVYDKLITMANNKGCFTILDAEGELFTNGLKAKPNLIKPNDHELSIMAGTKLTTREEIIEKAREINASGIEYVLVSLGGEGSVLVTKDQIVYGKSCNVTVKSTVGAGDSMVAAFIYSKLKGFSLSDTIAFANATGAATVMLPGTEACTMEQVNALFDEAKSNVTIL